MQGELSECLQALRINELAVWKLWPPPGRFQGQNGTGEEDTDRCGRVLEVKAAFTFFLISSVTGRRATVWK